MEAHGALAMKCPKRKAIMREKKKEETEREKTTFSDIMRAPQQQVTHRHTPPEVTKEEALKINICVAHAHYKNLENPGSNRTVLNKILAANNLPTIVIPECPDSTKIYKEQQQQKARTESTEQGSGKTFVIEQPQVYNLHKANWDFPTDHRSEYTFKLSKHK